MTFVEFLWVVIAIAGSMLVAWVVSAVLDPNPPQPKLSVNDSVSLYETMESALNTIEDGWKQLYPPHPENCKCAYCEIKFADERKPHQVKTKDRDDDGYWQFRNALEGRPWAVYKHQEPVPVKYNDAFVTEVLNENQELKRENRILAKQNVEFADMLDDQVVTQLQAGGEGSVNMQAGGDLIVDDVL